MAEGPQLELQDPWMIAGWPGMGSVALGAAGALVRQFGGEPAGTLPGREFFDVDQVGVTDGLVEAGHLPRSTFFVCRQTGGPHDLVVFIGEAQPAQQGYAYAHRLLAWAQAQGVTRVFTFAAMASQLHPSAEPEVFGVATTQSQLEELKRLEVTLLEEGQISGLNGVLLAAAAERGVDGTGLLGQIPFFAAGVPSPRASLATLEVFASMAHIDFDRTRLREQADEVEKTLLAALTQLQRRAEEQEGEVPFGLFGGPGEAPDPEPPVEAAEPAPEPRLDLAQRERIERLFERARQDRSAAVELKHELDRLGVFDRYEDRFLDLFKRAE
jgi:predicted ATP-grasp superfamily ATP-dependent carboligase